MKLLKLKIENEDGFRSLQKDFEINFHTLGDTEAMGQFRPFCFAGLNGSGKSNVLEALANIFYHLEVCVARYLPESIKDTNNFKRNECTPDAFTLEYLIGQHNRKAYALPFFDKVTITKEEGKEPKMLIQPFPFDKKTEKREVSLIPPKARDSAAEGKVYLPDHIIGYSSGENEILSLPFIKSRLIHLDEYRQAVRDNYDGFKESENSLIYIDSNMSQAVLLCCLLFENDDTLSSLKDIDNTGILGFRSFRIHLNLKQVFFFGENKAQSVTDIIERDYVKKLKMCSTSWHMEDATLHLDYYVNDATKAAFRYHFNDNPFECFQLFRLLYELNSHFLNVKTKENIYKSKGVYTDWKLPTGTPEQDVFHFLDFYISKKFKTGKVKNLLLRDFSDGEHQFIHSVGICLLMKNKRTLLLLDEPETHFNPSWRARFVKILHDSINASKDQERQNFNIHLMKDILMTSHSPFIISDCLPDNVVLFEKDKKGDTLARKVSQMDESFNTFGSSVSLILNRLFNYRQTIGDLSLSKLHSVDYSKIDSRESAFEEISKIRSLGESIEKDFVFSKISKKLKDKDKSA